MEDTQGTMPQPEPPEPTTMTVDSPSLSIADEDKPKRESGAPSTFDHLMRAEESFFRTVNEYLSRLAAALGVPQDEVTDVVQEVWLDATRHRAQFTGLETEVALRLRCWLTQVVYHKSIDALRRLGRHVCEGSGNWEKALIDTAETNRTEMGELREWLDALLEKASLGSDNVRLLQAHYFLGLAFEELAKQWGMTEDAIASRVRRLVKKVRQNAQEEISINSAKSSALHIVKKL